jgi:hypothetical protein
LSLALLYQKKPDAAKRRTSGNGERKFWSAISKEKVA